MTASVNFEKFFRLAVRFSLDRGENYVIFDSHVGKGDNKQ